MEYAEDKPWVPPSKALPLPRGTGRGAALQLLEAECTLPAPAWAHHQVPCDCLQGWGRAVMAQAVVNNSLTVVG